MLISKLVLQNFRNFELFEFNLGQFNLVIGPNGSGKTSVIEGIYYTLMGKSFRTSNVRSLLNKSKSMFVTKLEIEDRDRFIFNSVKLTRDSEVGLLRMLNSDRVTAVSLAKILPCFCIAPDSYLLWSKDPDGRRGILDKVGFYLIDDYSKVWSSYMKVGRQYRAAMKDGDIILINQLSLIYSKYFEKIFFYRNKVFHKLSPLIIKFFYDLVGMRVDLAHVQMGDYNSDLKISMGVDKAVDILSRGQAKLLTLSIIMAQVMLIKSTCEKNILVLVDDPVAELGEHYLQKLFDFLLNKNVQVIITCLDKSQVEKSLNGMYDMFHVKHI